jgi:hypothetical protein
MSLPGNRVQVVINFNGNTVKSVIGRGPQSVSFTVPSAGTVPGDFIGVVLASSGTRILDWSFAINCAAGGPGTHFDDGGLNFADPWETTAIYCMGDGSVRVYVIGSPNWTIDFDASPDEIAKVPQNPADNTLIKRGRFAALSRQTNGLLLVSSPGLNPIDGDYVFIFKDCPVLPAVQ